MNLGDIQIDSDDELDDEQPAAPATAVVAALQRGAAEVSEHNAQVGPRMTPGERKFVVRTLEDRASLFSPLFSLFVANFRGWIWLHRRALWVSMG